MGIREKTIFWSLLFITILIMIIVMGPWAFETSKVIDLNQTTKPPSVKYIFGTDWMGRSMFSRTLAGLAISTKIGLLCSIFSGAIALTFGVLGPLIGGKVDYLVSWLIDLVLSVPHTLVVILISVALGGGMKGIVIGVTLTHWTTLTRVIRAHVKQLLTMEYVKMSKMFGKDKVFIATKHI